MLSGDQDLPDGIGMARLAWSRLPTADGAAPLPEGPAASTFASAAAQDELFVGAVESLDYEVIENYAYREEQVRRQGHISLPPWLVRGFGARLVR